MLPMGAANSIFSAYGRTGRAGGIGTPLFVPPRGGRPREGGIQLPGPRGPGRDINYAGAYRAPLSPMGETTIEANPQVARLFAAMRSRAQLDPRGDVPSFRPMYNHMGDPWGMPMHPQQAADLLMLLGLRQDAHGLGSGSY